MDKWRKAIFPASFVLVLLLPVVCLAQHTGQRNESAIRLDTTLVVVDSQILNKKASRAVESLKKEDFIISEDGVRQKITHFNHDDLPLSVLLLVDISGSVGGVLQRIGVAVEESLKCLKPADKVALMVFDSAAWLVEGFTTDKRVIANRIHPRNDGTWDAPPAPGWNSETPFDGTRIADSIFQAAEYMRKSADQTSRRAIIVITDNWADARGARYSHSEVTNELLESGAIVYGLKVSGSLLDRTASTLDTYTNVVRLFNRNRRNVTPYAKLTGGVVLEAGKNDATAKLRESIDLLRRRYSFGYVSSNSKMDGKFRRIKLKVTPEVERREGGVIILTRQGYYARKPGQAK